MEMAQIFLSDIIHTAENGSLQKEKKLPCRKTDRLAYVALLKQCQQIVQIVGIIGRMESNSAHIETVSDLTKDQMLVSRRNAPRQITTLDEPGINATKLNSERLIIEQLITIAINDLQNSNGLINFSTSLKRYSTEERTLQQVLRDGEERHLKMRALSSNLDNEKFKWKGKIENASSELGRMKDSHEDVLYESQIKARYVTKWEAARQYQHQSTLLLKENQIRKQLKASNLKQADENIIHNHIKAYITAKEADYWRGIEEWSKKHDEDMAELVLKIAKTSADRERLKEKFTRVSNLYNSQQKEINDYLIVKEKRIQEEKLHCIKNDAALKIQSWWRGVMVRRGLGPYRKKKGKKGCKPIVDLKKGGKKKKE